MHRRQSDASRKLMRIPVLGDEKEAYMNRRGQKWTGMAPRLWMNINQTLAALKLLFGSTA